MCSGISSIVAAGTLWQMLLLTLLPLTCCMYVCPSDCTCNTDTLKYECTLNNGTLTVNLDESRGTIYDELKITCKFQNQNVSCADIPHVGGRARKITVANCSPRVLKCVENILDNQIADTVDLNYMSVPFTGEDVKDLKHVDSLTLRLPDDAIVPVTGINSWPSLEMVTAFGGVLQATGDKFNHTILSILEFSDTKINFIEDGFFKLLPALDMLTMDNSGVEEIHAGALKGLNNLTLFGIFSSPLKSIDTGVFADVPKLDRLLLNIQVESVPNELLAQTKLLKTLDLNCRYETNPKELTFGSHVFSDLISLKFLTIESCKINDLSENLFRNSYSLSFVEIKKNIINKISSNVFYNQTEMISLEFYNNGLHELPDGIFRDLAALEKLDLKDNYFRSLPDKIFHGLTAIQTIDLSRNGLKHLFNETFRNLTTLRELNLGENELQDLHPNIFNNLTSLDTLQLHNNNISDFPVGIFDSLSFLWYLNLAGNRLVQMNHITNLKNLNILDLSGNMYKELASYNMFDWPDNITEINLSRNVITLIDTSLEWFGFTSPFERFKKLKKLDLSGNKLETFFDGWKLHLNQTESLDLSNNLINNIKAFQIDYSELDITIDLRHNKISEITLDPRVTYSAKSSKSRLFLDDNPLNCDCNAYGLYLRLKGGRKNHEPQYILKHPTCVSPDNLNGSLLNEVSPNDLICNVNEHSPNNCRSFIFMPAANEVSLQCSKLPSVLPDLMSNKFSYIVVEQPKISLNIDEPPQSIDNTNINKLNVSNANMHNVTFKPTDSLEVLDLSHNKLYYLPDYFFNANISLYLSDNPLICDCRLARKLKNYNALADAELVYCASEGKNLTDIDEEEICNRANKLTAAIGITAVCGLIVIVLAVAFFKYVKGNWQQVKNNTCIRKSDNSIELQRSITVKKYDVFISFADEDEEFVRDKILPKLECEFSQKVCVSFRDWTQDVTITEHIIHSVENSRATVII